MSQKPIKTRIGEIGKNQRKVTIADEVEITSHYSVEPSTAPRQLIECWLDPSELAQATNEERVELIAGGRRNPIAEATRQVLLVWLPREALESGEIKFEMVHRFSWAGVKHKVLRKFNVVDIGFNCMAKVIHSLTITSRQPLYDNDAHANRVRNILRSVKVRHPQVCFVHEGCTSSLACPIGLHAALEKLALETHGKMKEN